MIRSGAHGVSLWRCRTSHITVTGSAATVGTPDIAQEPATFPGCPPRPSVLAWRASAWEAREDGVADPALERPQRLFVGLRPVQVLLMVLVDESIDQYPHPLASVGFYPGALPLPAQTLT